MPPLLPSLHCPHCIFSTTRNRKLRYHTLIFHSTRHFHKCPLCPHTFSRKTNLTTHVRTHDKSRPRHFLCPYCGHRTDRRNDLDSHIISRHQVVCTQEERLPWESAVLPAYGWDAPWSLPSFDNDAFTVLTHTAPPATPPMTPNVVMDQELHSRTGGDV